MILDKLLNTSILKARKNFILLTAGLCNIRVAISIRDDTLGAI